MTFHIEDLDDYIVVKLKELLLLHDTLILKTFCINFKNKLQKIHNVILDKEEYGKIKYKTTYITSQDITKNKLLVFICIINKCRLIFQDMSFIIKPNKIYTFKFYTTPAFYIEPIENNIIYYILLRSPT